MSTSPDMELQLSGDGVVLPNLKSAAFKMSIEQTSSAVIAITSYRDLLFVSVEHQGLNIYR